MQARLWEAFVLKSTRSSFMNVFRIIFSSDKSEAEVQRSFPEHSFPDDPKERKFPLQD